MVTARCMINTEVLFWKSVANDALTVVNFFRSRPLSNRLFSKLVKRINSEYKCFVASHQGLLAFKRKGIKTGGSVDSEEELSSFHFNMESIG